MPVAEEHQQHLYIVYDPIVLQIRVRLLAATSFHDLNDILINFIDYTKSFLYSHSASIFLYCSVKNSV